MRRSLAGLALACCLLAAGKVRAQGCSQCRDTITQTNPGLQQSYRTAIGVMLAGVGFVCTAGVIVLRRMR